MIRLEQCPVCKGISLTPFSSWDHPKEHRRFVKCDDCDHLFAAEFSPEELDRVYRDSYYPSADDPKIQEWIEANRDIWNETVNDIFRFRKEFSSILDYGAGTGGFLECFKAAVSGNLRITAIESSAAAIENIQNRFPGSCVCSTLDECVGTKFDCIAVLQCFEHLSNPLEICRELHSRLSSGGIMVVTVPNRNSLMTLLKGRKDRCNPGNITHLQFFHEKGMVNMLKQAGFRKILRLSNYPEHGGFFQKSIIYLFRKLGISSELRFICIAD